MNTALAEQPDHPTPSGEGAPPPKKRLNYHQRALIVSLRKLDHTHQQIADHLGISTKSVQRVLECYSTDRKQTTKELMETGILESLDDWTRARKVAAKRGDHRPSKDWMVAAGAIDADAAATVNFNFQAVVAPRPGLPGFALEPPTVEAELVSPTPTPPEVLSTPTTERRPLSPASPKRLRR